MYSKVDSNNSDKERTLCTGKYCLFGSFLKSMDDSRPCY